MIPNSITKIAVKFQFINNIYLLWIVLQVTRQEITKKTEWIFSTPFFVGKIFNENGNEMFDDFIWNSHRSSFDDSSMTDKNRQKSGSDVLNLKNWQIQWAINKLEMVAQKPRRHANFWIKRRKFFSRFEKRNNCPWKRKTTIFIQFIDF